MLSIHSQIFSSSADCHKNYKNSSKFVKIFTVLRYFPPMSHVDPEDSSSFRRQMLAIEQEFFSVSIENQYILDGGTFDNRSS